MYKKLVCLLLVLAVAFSMFACGSSELQKTISEQEDKIAVLESQLQEESEKNADLEKELTTESNLRKKAETKLSEYEKAEEEAKEEAQSGIIVSMTEKSDAPVSQYLQDVYRNVYMTFTVENKTSKDIAGIEGVTRFYDIFGKLIKELNCDFVESGIKSGDTVKYEMQYTCNMYISEESKFCNTEFENMTLKFEIKKVIYSDGTEVNYG